MRKVVYISLLFFSLHTYAQVNLDSLWKVWNSKTSTTEQKLDALINISFDGYIYSNPDSAYYFAGMANDLAKKEGNKKYEAKALAVQGTARYFKSDYAKAIDYFTRALTIQESIGDKHGMASTMNNMGAIYTDQENNDKALDLYLQSMKIRESIQDKEGMAASYNNVGAIYAEKGDYIQALEFYTRSLKIREELKDKVGIATSYNNMGKAYSYMGNEQKARELYEKGLKIREEIGDKRGLTMSLYNIALNYQNTGKREAAIDYAEKAMKAAKESGSVLYVSYVSQLLYENYKALGKYKEAYDMFRLYNQMNDSVRSENNQKEILKQEMQYNYEKQKAIDEKEHEKKIALAAEQEEKQRTISYLIGTGLFLVLLFALFIYNRLQLTRRQKIVIESQKHIVDEKQKEILDSITYAKRLQDAILPTEKFVRAILPDSFIFYKPKEILGGDFYWIESAGDTLFIAVADCSGHGVPGAMVSVVCSNALNRSVFEFGITEPGKILSKTKELILETFEKGNSDVRDGMDISLAGINRRTGEIRWAGANNPLWYITGGELKEITADPHSIGKGDNNTGYTTHKLSLSKGDLLFLFTDGYADQAGGPQGMKFSYSTLQTLLTENAGLTPEMISRKLEEAFTAWKGNLQQVDDICIIGIKI